MNEAGVGRSGGITNWYLMDVASMWACLADQDTTNHWRQVAGWRKICDLAQTHLGRLQEYRRGLAEAWPPETNEASRAYLAELDQLIDRVQRTHDAAATNYTALSAATQAIGTTRETLRKIYDEYVVKLQQRRAYEATVADPKAVMGSRVTEPPVTDVDLERLNVQARGVMYGLSGELQQAQVMLRQPPPSPPRPGVQPNESDVYGGSVNPPAIPPIVPVPITSNNNTHSSGRSPSNAQRVSLPATPSVGPVLGGASTGLAPAPPTSAPPIATPTSPANPSGGASILPPSHTTRPIAGSSKDGNLGRASGATSSSQTSSVPRAAPSAMPPGGLIGGFPGAGLGQPANASPQPRRVNPIGGVIGGGGAGTAPTGSAGSRPGSGRGLAGAHGTSPIGGAPGIFGASGPNAYGLKKMGREDESRTESGSWDPDHPWTTQQGVNPVVLPPEDEGPIDPGPAIGLGR